MKVYDVFSAVTLTELMQQSRFDTGSIDELSEKDIKRLLSQLNRGLLELYKRFKLKTVTQLLKLEKDKYVYTLNDDVLEVISLYDKEHCSLPLNRNDLRDSFRLNQVRELEVPKEFVGDSIYIFYQATHKEIPYNANHQELFDVELELPDTYLEAIILFIASRMTAPLMGGNSYNEGHSYYQRFEMLCNQLINQGIDVEDNRDITLFHKKGFV